MKNKNNVWKTATIVLAVICSVLLVLSIVQERNNETVDLGKFKIKKTDMDNFVAVANQNNWDAFTITNMETGESMTFRRQG